MKITTQYLKSLLENILEDEKELHEARVDGAEKGFRKKMDLKIKHLHSIKQTAYAILDLDSEA